MISGRAASAHDRQSHLGRSFPSCTRNSHISPQPGPGGMTRDARVAAPAIDNGVTLHGTQVRHRNIPYEISDEISSRTGFSGMVNPKASEHEVQPFVRDFGRVTCLSSPKGASEGVDRPDG